MSKYHYAYNESHELISIDQVTEENRREQKYYCISCGKELIPRLGKARQHHFAHKEETECNSETYLHKLAKLRIREAYNSRPYFWMSYPQNFKCKDFAQCPSYNDYICKEIKPYSDNLKKYFDTCLEEQTVKCGENTFIADLLLKDSTGRFQQSILIEIWVNHKSTDIKLNSGLKIIEAKITSEEDIDTIIQKGFYEGCEPNEDSYFQTESNSNSRFYNFKNEKVSNKSLGRNTITRFIYFKKGSCFVPAIEEPVGCEYINKRYIQFSAAELTIDVGYFDEVSPYNLGLVYLLDKGLPIRNCMLCKYRRGYDDPGVLEPYCGLSKKFGTPYKPKQEEAQKCQYYRVSDDYLAIVRKRISEVKITEVPKTE